MKNLYLISGLGADQRAFQYLDLSLFKVIHIYWIQPEKGESIQKYASRLLPQIVDKKPILLGLSFGGIMAIEIAKLIETKKIILISSAQTKKDIPAFYRLLGRLGITTLVPASFFKNANSLTYWFFGVESTHEKALLKSILEDTTPDFLAWAIHTIVNWRHSARLPNVYHIHGTADRVLPLRKVDYRIQDGGHFMILNKHKEITQLLNSVLEAH